MNILLITPFFYPHKGGSQQYAEELYVHLMKLDPTIEVDVITYNTDNAPAYEEYRGLHVYRIPCVQLLPGQFALPDYITLFRKVHILNKERKYAFINSHTRFFENSWWTPLLARSLGTRSVLTDHCAFHPNHPSAWVRLVSKLIDITIVPFFCNQFSTITVTNKATLAFDTKLGLRDPVVVYGGVDTNTFKPQRAGGTRKFPGIDHPFGKDDLVITFVGRMIYSKGPQLLAKASKSILESNPNAHVIFVGGGELYHSLLSRRCERMHFTGPLFKNDIAEILNRSDILVHPSIHHEGFPNVLLEAGAAGCAVVSTAMGGSEEIVIHDRTGRIIEPNAEAIEHELKLLINNQNKRQQLGVAIRKHVVEHFDWNTIAKDFKTMITERIVPDYTGNKRER